jgi:hypothetical protein
MLRFSSAYRTEYLPRRWCGNVYSEKWGETVDASLARSRVNSNAHTRLSRALDSPVARSASITRVARQ